MRIHGNKTANIMKQLYLKGDSEMKKTMIIIYCVVIVCCFVLMGYYIIDCFSGNQEIVEHEYGNTPGNYFEGHAVRGEKGLYFNTSTSRDELGDIYFCKDNNIIECIGVAGYDLFYYAGYLYFVGENNGTLCIYKMKEDSGNIEIIFALEEHDGYKLNIDSFIDGNLLIETGKKIICIDTEGNTKDVSYDILGDRQFSNLYIECIDSSFISEEVDQYFEWEQTFLGLNDYWSRRQICGNYIFAFEKTDEAHRAHKFEPRQLYLSSVASLICSDVFGDDRLLIDENVTVFNVTFDSLFYSKQIEEGLIYIYRCDLDGKNKELVADVAVKDEHWGVLLYVSEETIILTTRNNNKDEYKRYVIDISSGEVQRLEDIIQ